MSCVAKLRSIEPEWVRLSFQPRIDWRGGGVRGDCVVGEYEYIMAYCQAPGRRAKAVPGPSWERLWDADVLVHDRPKALLTDIARRLPNRTLMLMGDSVMEQFYNVLQCFLRREGLEVPPDASFQRFLATNRPLWLLGSRKMAPKLPQQAATGMRLLFERAINYQRADMLATVATADVIILNWGLHYHDMNAYRSDLASAFEILDEHAAKPGKAVLFMETGAQHFKAADRRGHGLLDGGAWETRDKTTDTNCACAPIEDFGINRQNGVLHELLGSGRYTHLRELPFYDLTRPRWRWHFGNCTHRPSRWRYDDCCDCSHHCFSPAMWQSHLHEIAVALDSTHSLVRSLPV